MTSSFLLQLDTQTQLAAEVNGGNGQTENSNVTLELTFDPDAVEVKIWGDINPLDPANAGMGETEAGAEWLPVEATFLVALTTNPALKHLHVRVRDDVWNEATADAAIQLGEGAPLPVPRPQRPRPAKGLPKAPRRGGRRQLVSKVRVGRPRDHASLVARRTTAVEGMAAPIASSRIVVAHHIQTVQVLTHVQTFSRARWIDESMDRRVALPIPGSSSALTRRDGPNLIAILEALDII